MALSGQYGRGPWDHGLQGTLTAEASSPSWTRRQGAGTSGQTEAWTCKQNVLGPESTGHREELVTLQEANVPSPPHRSCPLVNAIRDQAVIRDKD